ILEGTYAGIWGRYLPTLQDSNHLSDSLLGTSVLFVYLGTVIVAPLVAILLQNYGSRNTAILGAWSFIASLPFIALVNGFGLLTAVMFTFGFTMGLMDISMNNCAILTEIVAGKPLLGSFHGSYSVAAAIGALLGGLYITVDFTTKQAFTLSAIVAIIVSVFTAFNMYDYEQEKVLTEYHDQKSEMTRPLLIDTMDTSSVTHSLTHSVTQSVMQSKGYQPVQRDEDDLEEDMRQRSRDTLISSYNAGSVLDGRSKTLGFEVSAHTPSHSHSYSHSHSPFLDEEHVFASISINSSSSGEDTPLQANSGQFSWKSLLKAKKTIGFFSCVGFLAAFGESGIVTWSVEFFNRYIECSQVVKGLGFTSFMVCMAIGRFSSDYLRSIYGRQRIIRVGGLLAAAGLVLVVLSVNLPIPSLFACLGFALTGLGLSTLIPIAFSSAGHLPGVHAGTALATVAMFTYSGSIVASPLLGLLSDSFGSLQYALLVDAVLLSIICPLSWGIIPESSAFKSGAVTLAPTSLDDRKSLEK
ncbi:MFS transporter, partial [archaeon]